MEGCGSMTKVVAHHIKPWSSHPELRYDPDNGIALCQACHDKIKDREGEYEEGFSKTVRQKKTAVADAMFVRYLKRDG